MVNFRKNASQEQLETARSRSLFKKRREDDEDDIQARNRERNGNTLRNPYPAANNVTVMSSKSRRKVKPKDRYSVPSEANAMEVDGTKWKGPTQEPYRPAVRARDGPNAPKILPQFKKQAVEEEETLFTRLLDVMCSACSANSQNLNKNSRYTTEWGLAPSDNDTTQSHVESMTETAFTSEACENDTGAQQGIPRTKSGRTNKVSHGGKCDTTYDVSSAGETRETDSCVESHLISKGDWKRRGNRHPSPRKALNGHNAHQSQTEDLIIIENEARQWAIGSPTKRSFASSDATGPKLPVEKEEKKHASNGGPRGVRHPSPSKGAHNSKNLPRNHSPGRELVRRAMEAEASRQKSPGRELLRRAMEAEAEQKTKDSLAEIMGENTQHQQQKPERSSSRLRNPFRNKHTSDIGPPEAQSDGKSRSKTPNRREKTPNRRDSTPDRRDRTPNRPRTPNRSRTPNRRDRMFGFLNKSNASELEALSYYANSDTDRGNNKEQKVKGILKKPGINKPAAVRMNLLPLKPVIEFDESNQHPAGAQWNPTDDDEYYRKVENRVPPPKTIDDPSIVTAKSIPTGMQVYICDGTYEGMVGRVVSYHFKTVCLYIDQIGREVRIPHDCITDNIPQHLRQQYHSPLDKLGGNEADERGNDMMPTQPVDYNKKGDKVVARVTLAVMDDGDVNIVR